MRIHLGPIDFEMHWSATLVAALVLAALVFAPSSPAKVDTPTASAAVANTPSNQLDATNDFDQAGGSDPSDLYNQNVPYGTSTDERPQIKVDGMGTILVGTLSDGIMIHPDQYSDGKKLYNFGAPYFEVRGDRLSIRTLCAGMTAAENIIATNGTAPGAIDVNDSCRDAQRYFDVDQGQSCMTDAIQAAQYMDYPPEQVARIQVTYGDVASACGATMTLRRLQREENDRQLVVY